MLAIPFPTSFHHPVQAEPGASWNEELLDTAIDTTRAGCLLMPHRSLAYRSRPYIGRRSDMVAHKQRGRHAPVPCENRQRANHRRDVWSGQPNSELPKHIVVMWMESSVTSLAMEQRHLPVVGGGKLDEQSIQQEYSTGKERASGLLATTSLRSSLHSPLYWSGA